VSNPWVQRLRLAISIINTVPNYPSRFNAIQRGEILDTSYCAAIQYMPVQ